MVLVVNSRGRGRLVELVEQGSVHAFQLVDTACLLPDDDVSGITVERANRNMRADSAFGDTGMTWAEVSRVFDAGDRDQLRLLIIGHHRYGAGIPFDPRPSGTPETT